jgi:hypothetical protein
MLEPDGVLLRSPAVRATGPLRGHVESPELTVNPRFAIPAYDRIPEVPLRHQIRVLDTGDGSRAVTGAHRPGRD